MNRYLLFVGSAYYPLGGAKDLVGDYETTEEARDSYGGLEEYGEPLTWAHILDINTGEVINLRS